ncbi:MAG: hypothetical protein DMF64_05670 [Acidobacteria bacterium]|nr:MAG: hypothetical protein DMF64_05670 [Acidobacteriota bacterium]
MKKHRTMLRLVYWPGALLFCLVALALPLYAQNNKATIVGTVTDPSSAVVVGAKVTATNLATNETSAPVTTDSDGTYTIPNLVPGNYRVTVEQTGFKTYVQEPVIVETNARVPIDVQLTLGQLGGETVTVTSEGPVVESETSVRGDLITGREVTDLPIAQRNFTLLAGLSPGVTRPAVGVLGGSGTFSNGSGSPVGNSTESTRFRESGGSVLAVNGARPTNNNFTLDGVDNNEGQFGQIATYPPPDAIAEFKVETSVPQAESGRAGGAIVNATYKSGGNHVHGDVYEFYQGRFASAVSGQFQDQAERGARFINIPNFNTHQFGGVVGGPVYLPRFGEGGSSIYKGQNRTFFFFNYEGQRNSTPAFGGGEFPFVTVPTVKMRMGDFSELLTSGTRDYPTPSTYTNPTGAPCHPDPNNSSRKLCTFRDGTIFNSSGVPFAGNIIPSTLFSPSGRNFLNSYPLPTESGFVNNYRRNRKEKYARNGYAVKLDHKINESTSIFGRYNKDKSIRTRDNNFPLGSSPNGLDEPSGFGAGEEFGNSRGVTLGMTHTFTPTIVNDARFGLNRVNIGINNPGINGALGFSPTIAADVGFRQINVCGQCEGQVLIGVDERNDQSLELVGDGGPFYFLSNNFAFSDAATVVHGAHTMKFGGDYRIRQNSNFDGGRNGGIKGNVQYGTSAGGFVSGNYFAIGPQDTGSAVANLLVGNTPGFVGRGTPGGPYFQSNKEIDFFAQDDWKARPDLTLNIGLRYDIFTQPTERFNAQSNYNPANDTLTRAGSGAAFGRDLVNGDHNNFGPRIGFAYSGLRPNKKVVLRGGYGLLYAVDIPGIPGILSTNPGAGAGSYFCNTFSYGTANCPQLPANFNFDTGYPFPAITGGIAPGQTFAAPAGSNLVFANPDVHNEMFHEYNLTLQYEFAPNWLAETAYVGNRGRNLLVVRNIGNQSGSGFPGSRQVTTHGVVQEIDYTGKSWYDAWQNKVEKRFSRGLSVLSTYTWSHAIDNSPGAFCIGGTGPSSCGFANPLRPDLDKGNSDFDVRHRFTFSSVYDLPFGRNRAYLRNIPKGLDYVIGGFQFNNIVTWQSGPPYTVVANGARADLIGDPTPTAAQRARGLQFNPAAFRAAIAPVFASDPGGPKFGTLGRNVFRGKRQFFWDASLFKNFPVRWLGEAGAAQLRVQAYNVLNHVNRFRPRNDLGDSLVGIDTSEQNRRQLEFSFKLLF